MAPAGGHMLDDRSTVVSTYLSQSRYGAWQIAAVVATFILLSPIYWFGVELRPSQPPDGAPNADLYTYYYPAYDYAFGRMAQGELPLWNPLQFCGVPLHADSRVGLWQPLNAVFLALPTEIAMGWQAWASLMLMGIGTALFLRSLGVAYIPAVFGGIVFAFCGAAAGIMSRPPSAATLAWAPLAMWMAAEHLTNFRLSSAVLMGIFAGLSLLGGSYGLAAAMLILLTAFVVYGLVFPFGYDPPPLRTRVGIAAFAGFIALGLSAVQWLPTYFWAREMAGGGEAAWNVHVAAAAPAQLPDLLNQFLSSTRQSLPRLAYMGIAPLPFVAAAVFHRQARRAAVFLLIVGFCTWPLIVARGIDFPLGLPHVAFTFPAALATAALAGLGLDRLTTGRYRYGMRTILPVVSIVFAAALGLFIASGGLVRGYLIVIILAVLVYAAFRGPATATAACVLVTILAFIDLTGANANRFRHPYENAETVYGQYATALGAAAEQSAGGRVALSATPLDFALHINLGMLTGLRMAGGAHIPIDPVQLAWWKMLAGPSREDDPSAATTLTPEAPNPQLLRYMAVRALIAGADAPMEEGDFNQGLELRAVRTTGNGRVFALDTAMPRVYWTPAVRTVDNVEEAAQLLTHPNFNSERFSVMDRYTPGLVKLGGEILALEPEDGQTPKWTRADATCAIESATPEEITVRVEAPDVGMVVLADSFAPGWTATVDGAPRAIVRANGMFRAVHVPQGEHVITFSYRPLAFYVGGAFTAFTLALLLIIGFAALASALWSKRPRRPRKKTNIQEFKPENSK